MSTLIWSNTNFDLSWTLEAILKAEWLGRS